MSRVLLNLVSVFLLFDGNPGNAYDETFLGYGCNAYVMTYSGLPNRLSIPCAVWYDARSDRRTEYYTETVTPEVGEVLIGCIYSMDTSGNRSDCVAPEFGPTVAPGFGECGDVTSGVAGPCIEYVDSTPATPGGRPWGGTDRVRRGPAGRR